MRHLLGGAAIALAITGIASLCAATPASAAPVAAASQILQAKAGDGITKAHYRRWRHSHRRRHWRGPRWYGFAAGPRYHDWNSGHRFRGGYDPSGCYFDEGGGRFYSCSAGGRR